MLNSEYYTSVLIYRAANEPEHCAYYASIFVLLNTRIALFLVHPVLPYLKKEKVPI